MKILVMATDYPNKNTRKLMYIHTRNLYYKKQGNEVVVLNFKTDENYKIDDIEVISLQHYKQNINKFKNYLLISHAPNIRNHYIFLKKYEKNFKNIVFFFHGHEVLKINKVYSKPYAYMKKNFIKIQFQNIYDDLKLYLWRNYLTKLNYKSYYIFVSKWMYKEFLKWTKIDAKFLKNKYSITYNGIGEFFEEKNYDYNSRKKYDFITIRTNLDGSKYAIDIVNDLAIRNPDFKFLIIGCGNYFSHNKKSDNIDWINRTMNHSEIIKVLNNARCALMPTRTDAQGLMMCEMATFGIPVITSDIDVCHEVFEEFENVEYINNDNLDSVNLEKLYNTINKKTIKNTKYFYKNTTSQEIKIFKKILGENK